MEKRLVLWITGIVDDHALFLNFRLSGNGILKDIYTTLR